MKSVAQHQIKAVMFASWPQKPIEEQREPRLSLGSGTNSKVLAALLSPPSVKQDKLLVCPMSGTQFPWQ